MARRIVFTVNRELMHFVINGRLVYYTDRKWGKWLQCLPENKELKQVVQNSRNKIPAFLAQIFTLSKEELAEYELAKTEQQLAALIIRDATLKGCKLISNEEVTLQDG